MAEEKRTRSGGKVIFFDVDGTLLPANAGSIPDDTVEALSDLQKNGNRIVLCTGRHPYEVKSFSHIPFDAYVLLNGQLVLDKGKKPVYSNPISGTDHVELMKVFHERRVPLTLVEMDRMFMNCHSDHAREVQRECAIPLYPIEEYHGAEILMATIYTDQDLRIGSLVSARWHQWACDLYPSGSGKLQGMKVVMNLFQVDRSDTMAFGDACNDIDMLKYAGIGVAMGNGFKETRQAADYVTGRDSEGGIAQALRHYGLI